jgi:malate/lactate dehydrogenase
MDSVNTNILGKHGDSMIPRCKEMGGNSYFIIGQDKFFFLF